MVRKERWTALNVDLGRLATSIVDYCNTHDFEAKLTRKAGFYHVQAIKADAVRTLLGARRCLDIVVKGNPNDFEVTVGTGDWGKNIAASAIVGAITLGAGLIAAGASAAAYKYFEEKLWTYIRKQVSSLVNSASQPRCLSCGKPLLKGYNLCPFCGAILK
ncbi:hypothetical protein [Candidatus Hecatella orcuttiae]|uniref:hypothetical protein n=1 Tax=Candidatus Hecatella orcuttiae TaxID=1935119 RepID=UPI002868374D|nr:hypothetical protein [Candidatus Hecatella orcuttiae]